MLCLAVGGLQAVANQPPSQPTGLLMQLLSEPLGIENPNPALSWIVNDRDRDEEQTAYQILVSDCRHALEADDGRLWDSGKVLSGESSCVRYGGKPLEPDRIYYWKVRTWDRQDKAGPYSRPQRFTTALKNWTASPIWAGGSSRSEANFVFVRKAFLLPDKKVESAIAHVTALSPEAASQYVYRLYINGVFVGAGPERGFNGINRYNTFDVTGLVRGGVENVVGAINYAVQDKRFMFQMRISFEDGTSKIVKSDEQWKTLGGNLVYRDMGNAGHKSYYHAPREGIDARKYPFGWKEAGFEDADWERAQSKQMIDNLRASATRNTEMHTIEPSRVVEKRPGHYFVDFGRNVVAGIRLDVEGSAGQEVEIRLGEELSAAETVRHNMRTGNTYQEVWTLRDGRQVLENFGYRVFRYAEILNAPVHFGGDQIRAAVLRHPFDDEAAEFASSDSVLNDVWELCKYTIKGTALDVYVDTHTRERRNYEGDALVNQLSHYCVDREFAFPRYSVEYLHYRPTWPTEFKPVSIIMAWHDYLYTGNADSLRRHYRVLNETKTLEEFINEDYLIEKPINMGGRYGRDLVDWPDSQRDS